jgi:hypothetical protein
MPQETITRKTNDTFAMVPFLFSIFFLLSLYSNTAFIALQQMTPQIAVSQL